MSSAKTPGASPNRGLLVIVLAVIGVLAIIAGILYVSGAANSIHAMDGKVYTGHHQVRAAVSFVVGIAFLIAAYVTRSRPAAAVAGTSGTAETGQATGTSTAGAPAAETENGTGTGAGPGSATGS